MLLFRKQIDNLKTNHRVCLPLFTSCIFRALWEKGARSKGQGAWIHVFVDIGRVRNANGIEIPGCLRSHG